MERWDIEAPELRCHKYYCDLCDEAGIQSILLKLDCCVFVCVCVCLFVCPDCIKVMGE